MAFPWIVFIHKHDSTSNPFLCNPVLSNQHMNGGTCSGSHLSPGRIDHQQLFDDWLSRMKEISNPAELSDYPSDFAVCRLLRYNPLLNVVRTRQQGLSDGQGKAVEAIGGSERCGILTQRAGDKMQAGEVAEDHLV